MRKRHLSDKNCISSQTVTVLFLAQLTSPSNVLLISPYVPQHAWYALLLVSMEIRTRIDMSFRVRISDFVI